MAGATIASSAASAKRSADEAGQDETAPSHHKYAEMARAGARVFVQKEHCLVKEALRKEPAHALMLRAWRAGTATFASTSRFAAAACSGVRTRRACGVSAATAS